MGRAGAALERAENGTRCFGGFLGFLKEILYSYKANFGAVGSPEWV